MHRLMTSSNCPQPSESPRFLTPEEWGVLTHSLRIELVYRVRVDKQGQERPWILEIDWRPLAVLAEAAALGHRLYEFMHLERPGDLLRYGWVREVDFGPELAAHVSASVKFIDRHDFETGKSPLALPFTTFDACFWRQESGWLDDEMGDLKQTWVQYRTANLRPVELDSMFGFVRAAQARLRSNPEPLLRHELALIDSRTHARDYWAHWERVDFRAKVPVAESTLDSGLVELIVSLARRADVRSISCPFKDRVLWRALVWQQIQRARIAGVAPREALLLAGPDSGLSDAIAEDWGGDIHIPWEGTHDGDLFIKPGSYSFDRLSAQTAGTVRAGLYERAHRYALVEGDLGEFPRDERVRCGGWTLYRFGVVKAPRGGEPR